LRALDFLEHIQLEHGNGCNAIRDHFTEAAFDKYDEDRESRLQFDNVPMQCTFELLKNGGPGRIWDKMPPEYRTRMVEGATKEKVINPMTEG
jgi:hypothetical protein